MVDCNGTIQRAADLIGAESADETILVNLKNGRFFGLGTTGALIWQYLENPCTAAGIAARLGAAFGVGPDEVRPDLDQFLASLAGEGLIVNTAAQRAGEDTAPEAISHAGRYTPPRLDTGTLRHAANGQGNGSDGGFGSTSGLS